MKRHLIILISLLPAVAHAQVFFGNATAIDGDTIEMGEQRIRLHGLDAVEAQQTCLRDDTPWECGKEARSVLAELLAGKSLQCQQRDVDAYGRTVATCKAAGRDIGELMVDAGYAVALTQYSNAYVEAERRARSRNAGIWNSQFEAPADFRAANPHLTPPPQKPKALPAPRTRSMPQVMDTPRTSSHGVYFRNCAAARAAGAAPLYRGHPGYREPLDADGDGVACEPYRGR